MSIILQDSWKIGFVINLRQDLKLENIIKSDNYEQHSKVKKKIPINDIEARFMKGKKGNFI